MTSTIRVDNFGPSAGGTTYSARGISKCWINFDGTGTIAARDSENVSSLTDNGTGDYTVNFSNAFGAADYAVLCSPFTGANEDRSARRISYAASNFSFLITNNTGTALDVAFINASTHGDLA